MQQPQQLVFQLPPVPHGKPVIRMPRPLPLATISSSNSGSICLMKHVMMFFSCLRDVLILTKWKEKWKSYFCDGKSHEENT